MFSENNIISSRQIKYLLFMEWIAKLCILLPVCLEKKTFGSVVFCIILGVAFWALILGALYRWMKPEETLFAAVSRLLGLWPARILYAIAYLYFLAESAVFLNLCAELASLYLLPEVPLPVLCLLPLACGIYLGMGGIELRGRFCEVIGPVVLVMMSLVVFLSAFGMEAYVREGTLVRSGDNLTRGGFEVFACIGGMFLPLLKTGTREGIKAARRAGIFAGVLGGSLCAIAVASYGKHGIAAVDFPAVRVMSNVKIPGNFLQRWDILFLALLLTAAAVTTAGAFWYMRKIIWQIYPGKQRIVYGIWGASVALSYLMAAGFLSAFTAICYFRAFNMQILIPVMLFAYIFLGIRSRVKVAAWGNEEVHRRESPVSSGNGEAENFRGLSGETATSVKRYKQAGKALVLALVLAAASFYLSGCTSREPEERLFPMALEISLEEVPENQMSNAEGSVNQQMSDTKSAEIPGNQQMSDTKSAEIPGNQQMSETESAEIPGNQQEENAGTSEKKMQLSVTYAWDDTTGPGAGTGNGEDENEQQTEDGSTSDKILTTFTGSTLMDIRRQVTAFSERYVDYSHIKAVILDENLKMDPDLEAEVMQWLSGEPAFASGLIVYPRQESGLTLQKAADNSSGQIGTYLEQLYKNNEYYRKSSTTLGNIIAEYFA